MARLVEGYIKPCTLEGVTYYEMEGHIYCRLKSSLTAKRVKKSPEFKRFIEKSVPFAKASMVAKVTYRLVVKKLIRDREIYYQMLREAKSLLENGLSREDATAELMELWSCMMKDISQDAVTVESTPDKQESLPEAAVVKEK